MTNEITDQLGELLKGKALRIYWFLLTHGECGIREIQRNLKIASPSTVSYHINKLVDGGLVTKNESDKYFIHSPVKGGIFSLYVKIGSLMIPRIFFYMSFLFVGLLLYLILLFTRSDFFFYAEDFLFIVFVTSGITFFGYETYKVWSMQPK